VEFSFTDDQQMLRRTVREFAEQEIAPDMMKYDESQEFPRDLMTKVGELGLLGIIFPEKYGGAGLDYVSYVIAVEEVSRVDGSIGISVAAHNSLSTKTEPSAGSDAGGTRSTARLDGDTWVVNGSKTFTTHGSVGDLCVVFAVTDPEKKKRGISAFAIEKGTPGYRPGKKENKLGLRASDTSEVVMEDCRLSEDQLIGNRGEGFIDAMKILDGGRISIAALALGMARGAYDAAVKYSQERAQFGKAIAEFQAIQFMLADMATEIDAAALLINRAAWLKDQGAKVDRALQIFGGYGYVKDYPVEKFYRDSKLCTIGEGTSEIQRLVIARDILSSV
jgi:alkylation response protein AidB-like acyl-CoA dehydrogenase